MIQALTRIREEREKTISYIATRWKIDRELAAESYDVMVRSFSTDGSASTKSIQNVSDFDQIPSPSGTTDFSRRCCCSSGSERGPEGIRAQIGRGGPKGAGGGRPVTSDQIVAS